MTTLPVDAAQRSSAIRRVRLSVAPSGYWWDGARSTARARGARAMPAATSSPSPSTGTGTGAPPVTRTARWAPR